VCRSGAGSIFSALRTLRIVEALTRWPSLSNSPWILLYPQLPEEDRNVLTWMLSDPAAQLRFGPGWADEAQRMVAQFRATHDLWARDPAFEALMARLRAGSPEFVAWWESRDVRRSMAGQKVFYYPDHGPLRFEYVTFQANTIPPSSWPSIPLPEQASGPAIAAEVNRLDQGGSRYHAEAVREGIPERVSGAIMAR